MQKLNVGFISNLPVGGKTGLSANMAAILPILYKTKKYNLFFLAQGMCDNDPNYLKLPFHCEGAIKNFDQNRFNQDEGYKRYVFYGNAAVESFVIKNKLDVVFALDDQWAFDKNAYYERDWFKHIKNNFFPIITLDSLPIIITGKEWAANCPNYYTWTRFAEKALKAEDPKLYGHVKTMYSAMKTDKFKPLSLQEKLDIRHKFNIQDDEKICLFLSRNQLRKLMPAVMEGLVLFKQKNPLKKLKLHLHCSFSEGGGWPLEQVRKELKLNKEDVLATYFCRQCHDWNVQPYEGEDLNCVACHAEKSRITAGVSSTIDESDLNKIYNMADMVTSCITSGGFERQAAEALLAGVPLASPNYSSGEDFVQSGLVYELEGTFTREVGTAFKKFVPDINSICKFFEYIYDLPQETLKQLTTDARDWAVQNFDANVIADQYQKIIDNCQPVDWERFTINAQTLKNPDAHIPNIENNEEWILYLYKNILNMDLDRTDSGFLHWVEQIRRGMPRDQIVACFKNVAVQKNQEIQAIQQNQNNDPIRSLLLKNNKKQLLCVALESIGDLINILGLIPSLKKSYNTDEWNIYFATKPEYFEVFDGVEDIILIPYYPIMDSEIAMTGQNNNKGYFDSYIMITAASQKFLNYLTNNNLALELNERELL